MIHVIESYNAAANPKLLEGMFRLRARIFRDKLGWDVTVRNGMEMDCFDDEDPVYIIHTNAAGHVNGSCRLLPTTGPTLLAATFADTLPDIAAMSAPSIWECTRLCVEEGSGASVSGALIAEIGRISLKSGIETILGNFDAAMLHIYRRLGCKVTVLGRTYRFGRPVFLGSFPVTPDVLDEVLGRMEALMPTVIAA